MQVWAGVGSITGAQIVVTSVRQAGRPAGSFGKVSEGSRHAGKRQTGTRDDNYKNMQRNTK